MYQIEAVCSAKVRFYEPCRLLAVFVFVCIGRHFVTWGNLSLETNCFDGLVVSGAFCFGGLFDLSGFLIWGLKVQWLFSAIFWPGVYDLEP